MQKTAKCNNLNAVFLGTKYLVQHVARVNMPQNMAEISNDKVNQTKQMEHQQTQNSIQINVSVKILAK